MKRSWILPVLVAAALAGCGEVPGYNGPQTVTLPTHIQKVAVRPIVNRTQFFGLEDKLRLRIEQEFIRDGRLPMVNDADRADGVIEAEIVNYIRQVVTYDATNQPEEYKLLVILNVRFIDRENNVVLWEEPRLDQEYRYFVETRPGGMTEDQVREILWDLYARDIVTRTIQGFGSVSSASERKIPTTTLPINGDKPGEPAPLPPPLPTDLENRTAPPSPY